MIILLKIGNYDPCFKLLRTVNFILLLLPLSQVLFILYLSLAHFNAFLFRLSTFFLIYFVSRSLSAYMCREGGPLIVIAKWDP
jgi:hypothetical protein